MSNLLVFFFGRLNGHLSSQVSVIWTEVHFLLSWLQGKSNRSNFLSYYTHILGFPVARWLVIFGVALFIPSDLYLLNWLIITRNNKEVITWDIMLLWLLTVLSSYNSSMCVCSDEFMHLVKSPQMIRRLTGLSKHGCVCYRHIFLCKWRRHYIIHCIIIYFIIMQVHLI